MPWVMGAQLFMLGPPQEIFWSCEDYFRVEEMHKRKIRKESEDFSIKEEVKEGIVEVFAGTKRRPSLVDETPSGDIFILPFNWRFIKALRSTLT